jgi:hypothetical protein
MIELHCRTCAGTVSADDTFCRNCGARAHEEPASSKKLTAYVPTTCPDERLAPVYDRLLTAMRVAGEVREVVIHDPAIGDVKVFAATFDAGTLQKKMEEVPFWLRKMIGL